jgi:hypothetical protein
VLVVRHGRKSQVDHLVDQHPVVFGGGDVGLAANADQDQPAIGGISYAMANAGAAAAADLQREMGNREAAVIRRNGIGGAAHPAQKLRVRELHRVHGKSDVDDAAGDPQRCCLRFLSVRFR